MKALFLTRDLPYPATNGYKKRNFFLLKELAARDIGIILVYPGSIDSSQHLMKYCKEIKIIKSNPKKFNKFISVLLSLFSILPFSVKMRTLPKIKEEIKKYISKNPVDVIICDSVYWSLNIPSGIKAYKMLYEQNIESCIIKRYYDTEKNIFKKIFAFIEYQKLERFQKEAWKRFDCCVVCSRVDKEIIEKKINGNNVSIINNGVDSSFFVTDSYPLYKNSLVYTGQIGWHPNEDAIIYFLKNIYPIIKKEEPQSTFWIVGEKPSRKIKEIAKKDRSVIITGFVDDVRPYIGESSVYVVPLRIGSGTRLKILEALSMKKAIVSTSIGCEGIEVEDNKHLLIRDEPKDFANAVLTLFKNDNLRMNLGENGRRLVEEKYDWKVVFSNLDEILNKAGNFKG